MIVAANKAEGRSGEAGILEAYRLGLGDPIAFCAEHGEGFADLFEALRPHVDRETRRRSRGRRIPNAPLKLAIVGRPNAGKSTLVNTMLGEERMITGPEAGITRDSISLDWEWEGKPVQLVDTAGLRKRAKVQDKLERLSTGDTRRAIDYAEVVVLMLDATRGLERRTCGSLARYRGRPRPDHRAQQMGRRRGRLEPVQRRQGGVAEGLPSSRTCR